MSRCVLTTQSHVSFCPRPSLRCIPAPTDGHPCARVNKVDLSRRMPSGETMATAMTGTLRQTEFHSDTVRPAVHAAGVLRGAGPISTSLSLIEQNASITLVCRICGRHFLNSLTCCALELISLVYKSCPVYKQCDPHPLRPHCHRNWRILMTSTQGGRLTRSKQGTRCYQVGRTRRRPHARRTHVPPPVSLLMSTWPCARVCARTG